MKWPKDFEEESFTMKYHYAIKAETTVKSWTNFKYKK
jgi:hypothetical protein